MKTLLKVLGLLVVLLAAIAMLVPIFVSMDDITDTIANQVQKTTGRTLIVEGKKSLSVFPSLALQLNQVRFSNKHGSSRDDMAIIESLDVHISWLSLLSKKLSVDQFVINNPDILLEVDAAGNANWDLLPAAESSTEAPSGEGSTLPADFDVSLGEVAIYGGRIRLLDHRAKTEQLVEKLDLVVSLPSLKEALALNGAVTWMGEVIELSLALTTPADLLEGKPFAVELSLASRLVEMNYRGNISEGGGRVQGSLELAGDSAKELAAWQGIDLGGEDNAYNRFVVAGDMLFTGETLQITGLEAKLDALQINGRSTLRLTETPLISADLDLGMLNLNPYLSSTTVVIAASPGEVVAANSGEPMQAIVWDDTPLDLSVLRLFNAKVNVRSSGLLARDITLGENQLKLSLEAGKLDIGLTKFAAYEGEGKGRIKVDARRTPYQIATNFNLTGINVQPLLADAIDFDQVLGKGQLQWKLQTSGVSQKDFAGRLNGTLGFKFLDGAVKGANIAAMVRTARGLLKGDASALGLPQGYDEAEQTDFSELAGTLTFSKGVGRNEDLTMASPLLRVSGEGKVDLRRTNIDYGLTVSLVDSIEGQGATSRAQGVAVPVRIKGPLHKIKIELDTKQAVEETLKDTLKNELFKRFGKRD
ncbi:MAG: AsmA protein [Halioglobus sp.]